MDLVYQDKYQKIELDKQHSIMYFYTYQTIKELSESQYIDIVIVRGAEIIKKYKPKNLLVEIQDFSLVLSQKAENQMQQIFIEAYKEAEVQKLAILLPSNFLAQRTVFQVVEVDLEYFFERGYFINEKKAIEWLTS